MHKPDFEYIDLIGVPFQYGGRGPNTYDCWGLVMELYRRRGIKLPDYQSNSDTGVIAAKMAVGIQLFQPCEYRPGAILAIRIPVGGHSPVAHVGVLLDHGRFIHTWEKTAGVTIERIEPTWKHRIAGAYRYAA